MTWQNCYSSFIFSLTFFLGMLIPTLSFNKPNKKNIIKFSLFFLILFSFNLLVQFLENIVNNYINIYDYHLFFIKYFILYFIAILLIKLFYNCKIVTSFFIVNFGYCFQHIGQYIYQLILTATNIKIFSFLGIIICLIFRLIYFIIFFLITKNIFKNFDEEKIRRKVLIVSSSSVVVLLTIVINSLAYDKAKEINSMFFFYYNIIASTLFAIFTIIINVQILDTDQINNELILTQQMLKKQKTFYNNEKDVIEALNIKSHDLKHQLLNIQRKISSDEFNDIQNILSNYDTFIKTGNNDVDIILTEKEIVCKKRNIRFTALIDGKLLSFIKESDLYSLLGNIIDNAIEATSLINNEEERVISISTINDNGCISIHEENYCINQLQKENNQIITSKNDKINHGFGLKSIQLITNKYNGSLSLKIDNNVFILDIIFPKI